MRSLSQSIISPRPDRVRRVSAIFGTPAGYLALSARDAADRSGPLRSFGGLPHLRQAREPAFGLERRHAAEPGGGHRLPVDVVGDVAGGEDAFDAGRRRTRRGLDIAVRLQNQLPAHQVARRGMADGDEDAVGGQILPRAGLRIDQLDASHGRRLVRTENLFDGMIPNYADIRPLQQPLLQNLFGPERIAPVHDPNMRGDVAEVQRLLDRGIAAADDDYFLAAEEKPVAGRAGRDAIALEPLLARQIEPLGLGAGRQDQRIGGEDAAAVASDAE